MFSLFAGVVDTADKHSFANISDSFRKKLEMVLMGYSGARGTLIYEKNLKAKISCQTPFKSIFYCHVGLRRKFSFNIFAKNPFESFTERTKFKRKVKKGMNFLRFKKKKIVPNV